MPPFPHHTTVYDGRLWFFVCRYCKRHAPGMHLVGVYINADGSIMTDSDESESETAFRVFETDLLREVQQHLSSPDFDALTDVPDEDGEIPQSI